MRGNNQAVPAQRVCLFGLPHLLHGFLFLLKCMAIVPELVHYLPVEVHLVLQSQTGVLQLVCHPLLLLQGKEGKSKLQ